MADASQVMANFNALQGCIGQQGSVSSGNAGQIGVYGSNGNTVSGEAPSGMLDSAFGATPGSILYRGTSGWAALTPGTPGQLLSTGGSNANPVWTSASGGGSTSPFFTSLQPPSANAFLLVTAAGITATLTDLPSGRGMTMNNNGSSTNTMSSMEQPVLSQSAFTVTACVYLASSLANNWFIGIGVADSSGKYDAFGWRNNTYGLGAFNEFQFSSINTFYSATAFFGAFNQNGPVWLRLQLTGGNFVFSASFDQENWETIQTVSATHYLGSAISKVGLIVDNNSTHHMIVDAFSWSQVTP
ncbi:hypothetical protein [Paraburkholderia fungorum]|uniref:hypothetical protein n=1 Tax=Paraburkholderia fungorum TaxID=134537 RepID=UPI00115FCB1E|nr:hypothetical protein [Paraburkholderia fungorum]